MPSPDGADELARERLAGLGLSRPGWVPDQTGMFPPAPASSEPSPQPSAAPGAQSPAPGDLMSRLRTFDVNASGRALLALAALCGGLLLVMAWTLLRPHPAAPPPAAAPLPVAALPSPTPTGLVVDVGGRVRRPGLVTLPAGSRVADALRAAGGAIRSRDLVTINLAARVSDGQLLLIGMPGGDASGAATGDSAGPVSLNSATVDQLDTLPGIGPVLAQRIVDWRTQHGGFKSVRDLDQVSGIGDTIYAELEPLVTV